MEKNIEYIDVYANALLKDIKSRVKQNYIELVNEEQIDKKMIEVIKGLCSNKEVDASENKIATFNIVPNGSEEDSNRVFCTLIIYYAAMYFDNLELLSKLLDKDFSFGSKSYSLDLFALDKKLSSSFDEEQYFDLLFNNRELVRNFYFSLSDEDVELDKDTCIRVFSEILKETPDVISENASRRPFSGLDKLITKKTIAYFGKELIQKSTMEQKENIICHMSLEELTPEMIARLCNLMKNENVSMYSYDFWEHIFNNLTDEEIIIIDRFYPDLIWDCRTEDGTEINYDLVKKFLHKEDKKKSRRKYIIERYI
jgi:hypothetical protein